MIQEGKRNYLDDYFRDKLFDYESSAPDDTWLKIDSRMKKKKSIIIWTVTGSIAASILILISIGVGYYFGSKHSLRSESNYTEVTSKIKEKSIHTKENNQKVAFNRSSNSYLGSNQTKTINSDKNINVNNNQLAYNNNKLVENSKSEMISVNSISGQNTSKQITSINGIKPQGKPCTLSSGANPGELTHAFSSTEAEREGGLNKIESRQACLLNKIQKNKPIVSNKKIDLLAVNDEIQTSNSINTGSKKIWALGGNAGPFYSAWKVDNSKGLYPDYYNSVEKPNVAYTGGLNVNMETSRWRFESGVYYSRSDQNLDEAAKNLTVINNNDMVTIYRSDNEGDIFISSPITNDAFIGRVWKVEGVPKSNLDDPARTNSNGYNSVYYGSKNVSYIIVSSNNIQSKNNINVDNTIKSMVQKNNFIQLPIIAGYKIIDRKIDVFISSGVCANILLSSKAYINLKNDIISVGQSQTIRTFSYSGILGFAFEMPIAKKINFRFEPRLSYSISSIDKNSNINVHPYAFGAFSGVSFLF